jgi:hypothetical protein
MASLWTIFVIVLEIASGMVEDGTGAVLMTFPSFTLIASATMGSWTSKAVQYKFTPLRCKDLNQHVLTDSGVAFYLGEAKTECVSI